MELRYEMAGDDDLLEAGLVDMVRHPMLLCHQPHAHVRPQRHFPFQPDFGAQYQSIRQFRSTQNPNAARFNLQV